jgi:hypothetical protein
MIDHDDLEQSSAVGVSGAIAVIITLITLYNIRSHKKNYNSQKLKFTHS